MLECLKNTVEIYICGERSADVEYINSLPGITLESIEAPTEHEQVTYRGAWNDIVAETIKKFNLELRTEVNKCYQIDKDCDYDAIFCAEGNAAHLALPWKYALAITLLEYRIFSTRINRFTLFDKDKAIELLKHYREKYAESLHLAIVNMDFTSCCLDCGGNPQVATWIP